MNILNNKKLQSLFYGVVLFAVQLWLILVISPEKSWMQAWLNLASNWDSGWYEAIAKIGYVSDHGPLNTGPYTSNVTFFPGYPYLARVLVLLFDLPPKVALLLVSQTATLSFCCFLFYMLRALSVRQQWYSALLIFVFPTSWFMFMGYSESLFILACCLMLWCATHKHYFCAATAAIVMTATRLLGIPILIAPMLSNLIAQTQSIKSLLNVNQLKTSIPFVYIAAIGSLGCLAFLAYCAIHFESWHLYFDMERVGWAGTADPLFLFRLPTWVPPPWGFGQQWAPPLPNQYAPLFIFDFFKLAAYTFSETLVPIFLWVFIGLMILMIKNRDKDQTSLTWFLASLFLFLFSCLSLYTRHYESMSRCLYPVWVLLVMSQVIHPEKQFFNRLNHSVLFKFTMTVVILIFAGFWLQLINRYDLGWWVA